MTETLVEQLTKTPEGMRLYQQERVILEVTELICEVMAEKEVSKSQLAERLGKTKGYITQLLDGRANMTLRTMSDVMWALDASLHVSTGPLSTEAWSDEGSERQWVLGSETPLLPGTEAGSAFVTMVCSDSREWDAMFRSKPSWIPQFGSPEIMVQTSGSGAGLEAGRRGPGGPTLKLAG